LQGKVEVVVFSSDKISLPTNAFCSMRRSEEEIVLSWRILEER
jgi:hypothetical protein